MAEKVLYVLTLLRHRPRRRYCYGQFCSYCFPSQCYTITSFLNICGDAVRAFLRLHLFFFLMPLVSIQSVSLNLFAKDGFGWSRRIGMQPRKKQNKKAVRRWVNNISMSDINNNQKKSLREKKHVWNIAKKCPERCKKFQKMLIFIQNNNKIGRY